MIVESIESIPSTFICSKYKFSLCRKYKCSLNTKYILQIAHFLIPQRAPAASQRAKLNPSDSELNVMWNTSDSDVEYIHVILNTADCGVEYTHVMWNTSDCGVEYTFQLWNTSNFFTPVLAAVPASTGVCRRKSVLQL